MRRILAAKYYLDLVCTLGHELPLEAQEDRQLGGDLVRHTEVDVNGHLDARVCGMWKLLYIVAWSEVGICVDAGICGRLDSWMC